MLSVSRHELGGYIWKTENWHLKEMETLLHENGFWHYQGWGREGRDHGVQGINVRRMYQSPGPQEDWVESEKSNAKASRRIQACAVTGFSHQWPVNFSRHASCWWPGTPSWWVMPFSRTYERPSKQLHVCMHHTWLPNVAVTEPRQNANLMNIYKSREPRKF